MVRRPHSGTGILHLFSIAYAFRPQLRARLTLRRRTLLRNPQIFGAPNFHRGYRYLCLHLRFHQLQHGSRHTFAVDGMLPYHLSAEADKSAASVRDLVPEIVGAQSLD